MKTTSAFLAATGLAIALLLVPKLIDEASSMDMETFYQTYPNGFKAEGSLVADESDKPYYADYWRRRLIERRGPLELLKPADRYFESMPYETRTPHRDKIRLEFIQGYFDGLNNPGGGIVGGDQDANWHGFRAGQQFRREHPEKLTETMKAFGYEALVAEGVWTVSFEHSGFLPRGASEGKWWWLRPYSDVKTDLPKNIQIPDEGIAIRITGFISPANRTNYLGGYGHLGAYSREFYATKIETLPPQIATQKEKVSANRTIK